MSTQTTAPGTAVAFPTLTHKLAAKLYEQLDLPRENSGELIDTMINTLMSGDNITDSQVQGFLIVAQAHKLNPWLKEIYAFPHKGGIMPIVGIDGWVRIITTHPQYDGHEFLYNGEEKPPSDPKLVTSITCRLYRKDRTRPTEVTEFMSECKGTSPAWGKTAVRMLRHRSLMQAGRYAFGLGGIHTEDDAEILAGAATATDPLTGATQDLMPASRKTSAAAPAQPAAQQQSDVIDVESRSVANAPAQPAEATPPPPPQAPPAAPEGGELASDGHKANLENKAKAAGTTLEAAAKERGFDLAKLTMTQFSVLRAHLMSGKAGKG